MKKLFNLFGLMALLLAALNFSACSSSNDDEPEVKTFNVLGEWAIGVVEFYDNTTGNMYLPDTETQLACAIPYIAFKQGGVFEWREFDMETFSPSTVLNKGSWVIKEDQLYITSGTPSFIVNTFTIESADKEAIWLKLKTGSYHARIKLGHQPD